MTVFINLFLILTLTHLEPERRLASVTTSKLDAGVRGMVSVEKKKKKSNSLSILLKRFNAVLTKWNQQSRWPNKNKKKKESCELMERMTKR